MNRELIRSEDGSLTLKLVDFDESYHSIHGALSESEHIFIKCGLEYYLNKLSALNGPMKLLPVELNVLEAGFGTGLNSILYAIFAYKNVNIKIHYAGIEKYPVTNEEFLSLDHVNTILGESNAYSQKEITDIQKLSEGIQYSKWGEVNEILTNFFLIKINSDLLAFEPKNEKYNIICFDAFSPNTQPELWTKEIFHKLYNSLKIGGILVTYSSKGIVKQALRESGFEVCRLPGPKGKRHIIRATRVI